MINLDELEKLANAATTENKVNIYEFWHRGEQRFSFGDADMEFISAANPQTVLEMIGEIKHLKASEQYDFRQNNNELRKQIESLRADNTRLREALRYVVSSGDKDGNWSNNWEKLYLKAREALEEK